MTRYNLDALSILLNVPNKIAGIYAIYDQTDCLLYVGKSKTSISDRLYQELTGSHNELLKSYLDTQKCGFRFIKSDISEVDSLEKVAIRNLRPKCNLRIG